MGQAWYQAEPQSDVQAYIRSDEEAGYDPTVVKLGDYDVVPTYRIPPPDVYQLSATGPRRNAPWLTVPIKQAVGSCCGMGTAGTIMGISTGTLLTLGIVAAAAWAIARPEGYALIPGTNIGR